MKRYEKCKECGLEFEVKVTKESQAYLNTGIKYCPVCAGELE